MKIGMRKPSFKKMFKTRTISKLKKTLKRSVNPLYNKKGMGIFHPKKALYNKIYKKTSFDIFKFFK